MKQYTIEDIKVIDDPIAVLRRRPSMYAGEKPRGPRFAGRLMHDLILLGALPARIDQIEGWWVIFADKDWLAADGVFSTRPFFHIIAFPVAGDNSYRTEVLLTAFADAVVTCGVEGCTWISGDAERWPLPDRLKTEISTIGRRRLIAFRIDDDFASGEPART
jgi:hypothetical protein